MKRLKSKFIYMCVIIILLPVVNNTIVLLNTQSQELIFYSYYAYSEALMHVCKLILHKHESRFLCISFHANFLYIIYIYAFLDFTNNHLSLNCYLHHPLPLQTMSLYHHHHRHHHYHG